MKKILFLVALCLGAVAAQAQNHAVGIRFGGSPELFYQHELSGDKFLRFSIAAPNFDGVSLTGTYNWHCCRWDDWTPNTCVWYLDAGVGGTLGAYHFKKEWVLFLNEDQEVDARRESNPGFMAGLVGSVAFGCRFRTVPISLEVDYRPVIGLVAGGADKGFLKPGLWNFGVGVKFHF